MGLQIYGVDLLKSNNLVPEGRGAKAGALRMRRRQSHLSMEVQREARDREGLQQKWNLERAKKKRGQGCGIQGN